MGGELAILRYAKLSVKRSFETLLSVGMGTEMKFFVLCCGTKNQKEGANKDIFHPSGSWDLSRFTRAYPFCLIHFEDAIKTVGLEDEIEVIDLMELFISRL